MNKKFRVSGKKVLIVFNCILVLLYLLVCLVPFLKAGDFWFISILGLGFPLLLIPVIICLLIWAFKRSKWVWLSVIAILLSWQQLSAAFGMHFFGKEFKLDKGDGVLRVMSWNVLRWNELNGPAAEGANSRRMMMDVINMQGADVLCLQEFFEPYNSGRFESNLKLLEEMGFAYHYFFPSSAIWGGEARFGMAILSRYPITDTAKFSFGQTPHSEGLMYADIKINGQGLRIFSVHMESSRIGKNGYLGNKNSGVINRTAGILSSLKTAYQYRTVQAELVREQLRLSPYPVILCGNLGDIPNSYAYFMVKGDMRDAFLEKGAGLGRTFRFISPTLRLDYVFCDKKIRVLQFGSPEFNYSDHYPLVVDMDIPAAGQ